MKNKLLALLGFILLSTPLAASAQQFGDFTYTSDGSAITITGYTGPGGAVTIPAFINGRPVKYIGSLAFQGQDTLTAVTLPDTLVSIRIGAFADCGGLTAITIPGSVTNIGIEAFADCVSLTAINVAGANASYSSLDGVLFDKLQTILVEFPGSKAGDYAIPVSVTSIGDDAFVSCWALTNVTIPGSVTNIGNEAFLYCSLASINIPGSTTSIGQGAFAGCTGLTNVIIPGSVTGIGSGAFAGCTSLVAIMVDAANASYSSLDGVLFDKSQSMLMQCPGGKAGNYAIPASVTNIGISAFGYCTSLTTATIPGSVLSIGAAAFESCSSLTSVTMLNGVASIEFYAFDFCTSLTNVTIPGSVTNIGVAPFLDCSKLKAISVDAANSSYYSADGVLFDGTQATLVQYPGGKAGNYVIPNGVTNIGGWALDGCTGLTGVTIPGSVTSIGDFAFGICVNLTNVTIVDGITSIQQGAFYNCTSLASVTIPGSVTNIGMAAFEFCTGLKGVFFKGNAPGLIGGDVFYGDDDNTVYYLPGTTGWGSTFGGSLTRLWNPLMQSSGVGPAGLGFNITGTADIPIVIEAATNVANASWVSLQSLNLTNGAFYFSDPNWTNCPARFYRIRSP